MKVLVFDIDGTLTLTTGIDGRLFRRALMATIPRVELESFDRFPEMTDAAIVRDICSETGEADHAAIEAAVLEHFLSGLAEAVETEPASFVAVPGARGVFSLVRAAGWTPAIATGGWRASAELKLRTAGIETTDVPLATSSETRRRVKIIRRAVAEATAGRQTTDVVYVGDGTWDIRACRELGIGFVGRAEDAAIDRLASHGARATVPDFADAEAFLDLLDRPDELTPSATGTGESREPPGPGVDRRTWRSFLAVGLALAGLGCGGRASPGPGETTPPFMLGQFEDDYGIQYSIGPDLWTQEPGARYRTHTVDNAEQILVVQNHADNPTDGDLWTRIDWIMLDESSEYEWAYCYAVYQAETPEAALEAAPTQRETPRTGCNGFPFSRMKRVSPEP